MITFKTDRDIAKMRRAGQVVADILKLMRDLVKPGIDTLSLDAAAEELILKAGGKPAFKGYKVPWVPVPFPGTICASINNEVVHGIPSKSRVLEEGELGKRLAYKGRRILFPLPVTQAAETGGRPFFVRQRVKNETRFTYSPTENAFF